MPPEEGLEVVLAKTLAVVSQCIKVCTRPEVVAFVQIVGRTDLVVVVLDEGDEGLVVLQTGYISYVSREGKAIEEMEVDTPSSGDVVVVAVDGLT